MRKQILAYALTLALCLTPALAAAEDHFPVKGEYPGYADVKETDWFFANAKLCYEIGLITGSDKGFEPGKTMRLSELVAIAARMRESVTGEAIVYVDPVPGGSLPWYTSYAEYLKRAGVALPEDLEREATRLAFVQLLAAVLPDALLAPVNTVTALPDTNDAAVLAFYRAGILTGNDKYGTFAPDKTLTRAEGAAMVSRVAQEGLRQSPFSPADYTPFLAAECTPTDVFFSKEGKTVAAEEYLPFVCGLIALLEVKTTEADVEFNWFNTYGDQTFLSYVTSESMAQFGMTKADGTALYQTFDVQVFYSRLLDARGLA